MNITHAFTRWAQVLDSERIVGHEDAQARYGKNTTASVRIIQGALRPKTTEEIQQIVKIASEERVPLYPISTGHNWGYGTAVPSGENNVILDLSLMNTIIDFDVKLGVVTVEPGVTLQDLYLYLEKNKLPFITPLTGAGLKGSLIGNALERGFGVTPSTDHFNAVTTLTAVLADGTIYNSPLDEYGCARVDQLYRYGVGPYLDGIFTQSNFGIVTKMTIALARKQERTEVFLFSLSSHEELGYVIDRLPALLNKLGTFSGGFKFVSKHQMHAMRADKEKTRSISGIPEWTVTGGLFGDDYLISAAKKIIKKELKGVARKLFFVNADFISKRAPLLLALPLPNSLKVNIKNFSLIVDLMLGKPNTVALPLAYLGSGTIPKNHNDMDPALDGAGMVWFAPLLPMDGDVVLAYVHMAKRVLAKYSVPPLLTFTSLNDRCFDSPLPIVFNKEDPSSVENAKRCFDELWHEAKKLGVAPYRLPIDEQYRITESGTPFWDIAEKIKDALDPHNIISPKRYSKK